MAERKATPVEVEEGATALLASRIQANRKSLILAKSRRVALLNEAKQLEVQIHGWTCALQELEALAKCLGETAKEPDPEPKAPAAE